MIENCSDRSFKFSMLYLSHMNKINKISKIKNLIVILLIVWFNIKSSEYSNEFDNIIQKMQTQVENFTPWIKDLIVQAEEQGNKLFFINVVNSEKISINFKNYLANSYFHNYSSVYTCDFPKAMELYNFVIHSRQLSLEEEINAKFNLCEIHLFYNTEEDYSIAATLYESILATTKSKNAIAKANQKLAELDFKIAELYLIDKIINEEEAIELCKSGLENKHLDEKYKKLCQMYKDKDFFEIALILFEEHEVDIEYFKIKYLLYDKMIIEKQVDQKKVVDLSIKIFISYFILGEIFYAGRNDNVFSSNYKKSENWFNKILETKNIIDEKINIEIAESSICNASKFNHLKEVAKLRLANIYFYGDESISKDINKALKFYKELSKSSDMSISIFANNKIKAIDFNYKNLKYEKHYTQENDLGSEIDSRDSNN